MNYKYFVVAVGCLLNLNLLSAQKNDSLTIKYSGYFDFFYAYDFNKPDNGARQSFLVNHNRHDQLALNLACAAVELNKGKFKSKLALQAGTFVKDNYIAEPNKYLGIIQEANIGFALNNTKTIWLEAGVLPSHIGYESAATMDNFTLTRSLASELTPYFLSGGKITFENDRWRVMGGMFNSWSTLFDYKKGQLPALGSQVVYKKNNETSFYWNTYIGSAIRDGFKQNRLYNNFYATWQATKKTAYIAALDIGYQRNTTNDPKWKNWFAPSVIIKRKLNDDFSVAVRGELFFDELEAVTTAVKDHAFDIMSASVNIDYRFIEDGMIRVEGRLMNSSGLYFKKKSQLVENNQIFIISLNKKF